MHHTSRDLQQRIDRLDEGLENDGGVAGAVAVVESTGTRVSDCNCGREVARAACLARSANKNASSTASNLITRQLKANTVYFWIFWHLPASDEGGVAYGTGNAGRGGGGLQLGGGRRLRHV